jgi:hypothetical protein
MAGLFTKQGLKGDSFWWLQESDVADISVKEVINAGIAEQRTPEIQGCLVRLQ